MLQNYIYCIAPRKVQAMNTAQQMRIIITLNQNRPFSKQKPPNQSVVYFLFRIKKLVEEL